MGLVDRNPPQRNKRRHAGRGRAEGGNSHQRVGQGDGGVRITIVIDPGNPGGVRREGMCERDERDGTQDQYEHERKTPPHGRYRTAAAPPAQGFAQLGRISGAFEAYEPSVRPGAETRSEVARRPASDHARHTAYAARKRTVGRFLPFESLVAQGKLGASLTRAAIPKGLPK
jgi:hypothetical protein